MPRILVACLLAISSSGAASQERPRFAEPAFPQSNRCSQNFTAVRSPDSGVLSILRVASDKNSKDFLVVGPGHTRHDAAQCTIEIRLEKPLAAPEVLSIDVRGDEMKDVAPSMSYTISVGRQTHVTQFGPGQLLDGSAGGAFKRLQYAMRPGTQMVRIKLAGDASSHDKTSSALVAIDSFDLCVVDLTRPEFCGSAGRANPKAPGASAPVKRTTFK